jgi:hypothetical protein
MRSTITTNFLSVLLLVGCAGSPSAGPGTGSNAGMPGAMPTAPAANGNMPAPTTAAPAASNSPSAPVAPSQPAMAPVAAMQPAAMPTPAMMQPATTQPTAVQPPAPTSKLAMDECGLHTKWPGDEYCINPPPADKGFQMHIGPADYNNPDPKYVMEPGTEVTETWPAVSGNKTDVYYYWRQYRMRPGSHHLIINADSGGGIPGLGVRIGGTSNLAKDNPEAGVIAPENKGVGMPLAANSTLSNSLHYFNFTDKPIIKEVWVNFWYRDKSEVTDPTQEMFSMLLMNISPGQHVLKHGACDISQPGRLLTGYGHVHAHNKRFSMWRTRGSDKQLIHESYDWEHPNISEFSSTVMNPMLNPAGHADGGHSGIVDLQAGDVLEFECDIVNDTQNIFVGQNEAQNDEMCIMVGDTVGTSVPAFCTSSDLPAN